MKGALLIHGWATDRHVWYKHWILDNGSPMMEMLISNDIEPIMIELPGLYIERDKDLDWYSDHIGHIIREREDLDEVIIIGHSMGGIVGRNYLTDNKEIFSEGRDRVSMLFSLASPNHGTSVPFFDIISRFLTTIADLVLPWEGISSEERMHYFMSTPCYRDIQIGSSFLKKLNNKEIPDHVVHHVLWTNGDTVADPQHTCILPGARNHLIDRLAVNHFNICYRPEVVEKIKELIQGDIGVEGPQEYPPVNGCAHVDGHQWLPESGLVTREVLNRWHCPLCGEERICHTVPIHLTCRNGGPIPTLHRWGRIGKFYRYKFRCGRCQEAIWYPPLPGMDG